MATPETHLSAIIDHLSRFAPFDQMERSELLWLVARLKLAYYPKGEVVLAPEQGEAQIFYIIKQGVVQGERAEQGAWLELHEGECFPIGALLSKRPAISTFRAQNDLFCYELTADEFHQLLRLSPPFHDFCTLRLAHLLVQSQRQTHAHYATSSSEQQSMSSPLRSIMRPNPITCPPETPLRQVLTLMQHHQIGSMIAVDGAQQPLGIFTLHDLLTRVALPEVSLESPLAAVMSTTPFTLPPQAPIYQAALAMARHGFRHLLITEQGRLLGLVSEKDLFALQRIGLRQVSLTLQSATSLEELQAGAADIRQLTHNMLAQGVAAEQLTSILSALNDLLTQRLIELELQRGEYGDLQFCWMVLGSEGRMEQTLNTDQDNSLIFTVPEGSSAEAVRQRLLPLAERITHALAACGFPLCKGNIMASNPQWCLSVEEWRETFAAWLHRGDAPVLLNATIFFDFRALYGATALVEGLRSWLNEAMRGHRHFLQQMVLNALGHRPPLGIVRDFVVESGSHTFDLKLNGVTPFVDAARIFALAASLEANSTAERLKGAAVAWKLSESEVNGWVEAFQFIQLLRMRLHHQQAATGEPLSNHLNPDTLSELDRRILKEVFRQARKLQQTLERYFQF